MKNVFDFRKELIGEYARFSTSFAKPSAEDVVAGFSKQPLRLYKHQRQAISHVKDQESYVVTTGTGSGKSLCFFIPIVNRIIEEKKSEAVARPLSALPGVQGRQFGERKGREPAGRHLGRRRLLKER